MTCSNWRSAAGAALLAVSVATLAAPDPKAARLYEDALTRFDQRDVKGAIIQLKNALQVDNSLLPVHLLLGRALLEDGQPAAAEIALNEAVRLGATYFDQGLEHEIHGFVFDPNTFLFTAANKAGESQRSGLELTFFGQWHETLTLNANYTYLDSFPTAYYLY